jgi:acyl-CoA thioesterase
MDVTSFLRRDRFASHAGVRLLEVREGFARATLEIESAHLNAAGTVQGGAIFTLADLAFAAATNSHGTLAVTIDASISFLRAVKQGAIVAEATEESVTGKLATCTVRVKDERGELVALMKGTALRKRETLEEIANRPAAE